jgi:hypothetical protein
MDTDDRSAPILARASTSAVPGPKAGRPMGMSTPMKVSGPSVSGVADQRRDVGPPAEFSQFRSDRLARSSRGVVAYRLHRRRVATSVGRCRHATGSDGC